MLQANQELQIKVMKLEVAVTFLVNILRASGLFPNKNLDAIERIVSVHDQNFKEDS